MIMLLKVSSKFLKAFLLHAACFITLLNFHLPDHFTLKIQFSFFNRYFRIK